MVEKRPVKKAGRTSFPGIDNVPAPGKRPRTRRNSVGRPLGSDSAETRSRILDAARTCFGLSGYDKTTNRDVADVAHITTGAIYHYFDSKQALFAATLHEVQSSILASLRESADECERLIDKIMAILDRSVAIHGSDPSLAAFASIALIEVQRHEELQVSVGSDIAGTYLFFDELVGAHLDELADDVNPTDLVNCLFAIVLGLSQFAAAAGSPQSHKDAVDAFKRMLDGSMFVKPSRVGKLRAVGSKAKAPSKNTRSRRSATGR